MALFPLHALSEKAKMDSMKKLIIFLMFMSTVSWAETPVVGRKAAGKFFKRNVDAITDDDHYMAIHFGRFMDSQAWEWGQDGKEKKIGNWNFGVTYKMGPVTDTMDWNIRVELTEYDVVGEKPMKLSFVPVIIFPEAASKFPIYFGGGLGGGAFVKQVKSESTITLDYQLFLGARYFDVVGTTGFFLESGVKNHLQLLSPGQANTVYLNFGTVFSF
jgi:hypothetical protein